jgi:hypothetical protein
MKKADLLKVKKILDRIKDPDSYVVEAKAIVDKDVAIYDSRKGQMRENYETERW